MLGWGQAGSMVMSVVDMFVHSVYPETDSDADGIDHDVVVAVAAEVTVDIPVLEEMMAFLMSFL